jgi:signal transduction histidine kinase
MKSTHFQLTIVFLLFMAGCNSFCEQSDRLQAVNSIRIDSLFTLTGNAQLDSLLQLVAVAKQDTNLARLYSDIGDIYFFNENDYQKAKEYYLKTGALSENLDWNEGLFLYAAGLTDVLNMEGLMDSSIVIHRQVLEQIKMENNELLIAKTLVNLGNCYNYKRWFETALNYYREALPIFEKRGNTFRLAFLYNLMGTVYSDMDMYHEAQMFTGRALDVFNITPDTLFRAMVLSNYATALLTENQQLDKAEESLLEAMRICALHNSRHYLVTIYCNLGDIAMKRYDLDKIELYARKALELAVEFGDIAGLCVSNRVLGYLEQYRGNFNKSEKYAREVLKTAIEYDLTVEKIKCYTLLSDLAIARHDFRNYRYYGAKSDSIQKQFILEKTRIYAKEMEVKYETEKKELEIDRQQLIIGKQNTQRNMLLAGVAVSIVILALLWYMLTLRNRSNRTLAEMNATKDKFFSIISHDLKNPALAQSDAIQMLVKNDRLWDADTLTDSYHELLKSADGEVELIYHLLNWAQVQTGRMTYTPSTFNLLARIRPDISLIRKMAESKGITFHIQMPEDLSVTADSDMLATVIRNLLTNAVKFTPTSGEVSISAKPVPFESVEMTITDTGSGMSQEQLRDLFRIDRQRLHKRMENEQSTGLGLIVCKELLDKHGSTLHVESEEGKGSTFWFAL